MARNQNPSTEELAQAGSIDGEVDVATSTKLKEARSRVAKLKADKELELLEAEEQRLKHGGKGPKLQAAIKEMERVRDETSKETEHDGVVMALYQVPERSYLDPTGRGKTPLLNERDSIVKVPISELPGMDWKPVKVSTTPLEKKYVAA